MIIKSKINLINKYAPKKEIFEGRKKILIDSYYTKKGEELFLASKESDLDFKNIVIVKNKKDERFTMLIEDLNIEREEIFNLFEDEEFKFEF